MAKVDFKLNDSLVRRQRGEHAPSVLEHSTPGGREESAGVIAVTSATPPPTSEHAARRPDSDGQGRSIQPARPHEKHDAIGQRRLVSVQTSVLLPPALWDQLARLAGESGGLATPNQLLIDILEDRGPANIENAAEDLERFLSLPVTQTCLGEPWEERNVRLPTTLRRRLDEHRRTLSAAGLRHATRAHLVAATILLRGPGGGEEARALMAERRAGAFRRALRTNVPTGVGSLVRTVSPAANDDAGGG